MKKLLLITAVLAAPALPAYAQAPATITCPSGTLPNPSYAAAPLTQPPCMTAATTLPAPVYVAPPAPVYATPSVDPYYWIQQQQIQQQQHELQMQRWQMEHMQQHPELYPGHPH